MTPAESLREKARILRAQAAEAATAEAGLTFHARAASYEAQADELERAARKPPSTPTKSP